ncbi:hypothetical protein WJX73_000763 [Symbiochloris irregularis]|uniref:Uncharacterized protein n=1 Tax=Symbiochloris irregularis TaxID=706552 RepID=A0AAW1NYK3_9CHLO
MGPLLNGPRRNAAVTCISMASCQHAHSRRRLDNSFNSPSACRSQSRTRGSRSLRIQAISVPRNWHAFRMGFKYKLVELQDQFWNLPAVNAVTQKYKQVQQPIAAAILHYLAILSAWWQDVSYHYGRFCTDETMREWKWRRKHEAEWDMWKRILLAAVGLVVTVIWEAIVPTNFFLAVVPPLFVSWALYDNWLMSPFILGLIIMLPLKFPIWINFAFWSGPGLC